MNINSKADMLAEVERRRQALQDAKGSLVGDEELLRRQLDGLEQTLYAGRLPEAEWEQHEMHWQAHCADLRRRIIRSGAHLMLAFEDMERQEPDRFIADPNILELLHWWREEGGREEFLGQITIGERRELEEMARQWQEKNP